ncbi:putative outer membrane starch-binding protein [Dysgonomonas alginatilytica]|uniref:Putative outer membrane starch-binding protein n=1 Tax=Dysgonomonas alginatilytica TaxID=1605892 RepID=A0A2V3PR73_9BACT|nr:RagB/SusD family nutrient uptake outer membrane protein [Dysgonomonas alginatilytica]PXV66300.1 putative outer membrane starch-binding protein [Dysgonomonas alginatilytica]
MKKYTIITCFLFALILAGCQDFLDKDPLDQLSKDKFYKNETEIQQGLVSTYLRYRSQLIGGMGAGNGSAIDMEALSDNAYSSSGFQSLQNIAQGGMTSTTGGAVTGLWNDAWQGIAYCNYFLDNLERPEVKSLVTDERYKQYRGEALFNRCYFYFLLIQNYGDVPFLTHAVELDTPYMNMKRESVSTVVPQLLSDMDLAIEGLPLKAYTDGHAVKGSAVLLKTRILMYNKQYAEAATTAYSLIGNTKNPHKIVDDYSGIFFGDQANNQEIMFSVWYASPDDMHQFDQFTGSRMSCYPLFDLVKAYEEKSSGVRDPRLSMTIFMVGDPWIMYNGTTTKTFQYKTKNPVAGGPDIILDPTIYSYSGQQFPPRDGTPRTSEGNIPVSSLAWKKGVNPALVQARDRISSQHCVLMRYADLLLLYAEAMFESGKASDPTALKALNEVRARKGVEMPPKTELTRDNIRNERRVELAYEGIRYYDIKRWDIAKDVIPRKVPNPTLAAAQQIRCLWDGNLWPIPQNIMNIMTPAGWVNNAPY